MVIYPKFFVKSLAADYANSRGFFKVDSRKSVQFAVNGFSGVIEIKGSNLNYYYLVNLAVKKENVR